MNDTAPAADAPPRNALGARINRLAHTLARATNGERAALKRWSPGQPIPLGFYRLWLHGMGEELPSEHQLAPWAVLAWGLALMGEGGHRPGCPLGQALAASTLHEARLERLLAANEDIRSKLFIAIVRFLAAKGEGFDWTEAARLLLTQDADKREAAHRRIAADYYRHLPRD
ncbi:MAG: type I-E CRISPR-associated protein Cse2/CasB [Halothiobacillaceae bacterium]|nr:MAG: type I-E CRISPR-associated protein Cse2/CasB [Halothiobacillaceae bacterium]